MTGQELYEQGVEVTRAMCPGEVTPAWSELAADKRMHFEQVAADVTQKMLDDVKEADRART